MNNFVYEFEGSLYINLTNRCSNACDFCIRNGNEGVGGSNLWLDREPTSAEVIAEIEKRDMSVYKEFVFCGFGEPTYRMKELKEIGIFLRAKQAKVRLNTNGQGSLINGYDITDDILASVDTVSISLNQSTAAKYQDICKSEFGQSVFSELIEFGKRLSEKGGDVIFSVVDTIPEEDIEECRKIAQNAGVSFRVREIIT